MPKISTISSSKDGLRREIVIQDHRQGHQTSVTRHIRCIRGQWKDCFGLDPYAQKEVKNGGTKA